MSTTAYEDQTKADLLAEAKDRGLGVTNANSKQEIIDALEADDQGGTVTEEPETTTEEATETEENPDGWEPREGPVYAESGPSKEPEQIAAEEEAAAAEEEDTEEEAS